MSSRMAISCGIAMALPSRAAAKASARRINLWRECSPYQRFMAVSAHWASRSWWQSLQAFGIPWRVVFSGTGMPMEWSRMRALMLSTVRGMWHSTQELPEAAAE